MKETQTKREKEMKKLVLNEFESYVLEKTGVVVITRNGFDIFVEKEKDYIDGDYRITIINPYDKVVLKQEKGVLK